MRARRVEVRCLETVGLQDVSAHPWGESLMMRPTVHRVMRVMGGVVVHVTLTGGRVVVVYFVAVTVLMTWTIVMGGMGLVAVVEACLVFVTLIVVLMVGCVLVMDCAVAIV